MPAQKFRFFLVLLIVLGVCPRFLLACSRSSSLWENPSAWKGTELCISGKVLAVHSKRGVKELEVLEQPLVAKDMSGESDRSLGRFILRVSSDGGTEGSWVRAKARVVGSRKGFIGRAPYRYPVLQAVIVQYAEPKSREVGYYYSAPGYPPWWGVGFGWGWPTRP